MIVRRSTTIYSSRIKQIWSITVLQNVDKEKISLEYVTLNLSLILANM